MIVREFSLSLVVEDIMRPQALIRIYFVLDHYRVMNDAG